MLDLSRPCLFVKYNLTELHLFNAPKKKEKRQGQKVQEEDDEDDEIVERLTKVCF
jgi:hypothetical protein